jgi:hypothetical protein
MRQDADGQERRQFNVAGIGSTPNTDFSYYLTVTKSNNRATRAQQLQTCRLDSLGFMVPELVLEMSGVLRECFQYYDRGCGWRVWQVRRHVPREANSQDGRDEGQTDVNEPERRANEDKSDVNEAERRANEGKSDASEAERRANEAKTDANEA